MHPVIQGLKERKLIQWALAYGAGAWLVLQILDVTAEPWGLSGGVIRTAQASLAVGFIITLVLAWYHGERGRQRVSGPELLIIAGILVISGLLAPRLGSDEPAAEEQLGEVAESAGTPDGSMRPSIAILPFANMSGDEGDSYFTDGIHEEILTRLGQLEGLRVISRTSVLKYGTNPPNIREIAQELGVDYVGEGSVRRAQDRVVITFQLIDASLDEHLWAESYERVLEPAQIFDVQRDVAQRIAASLETRLTPEEEARIASVPTEDLEAYDLYLRGREGIQAGTIEGFNMAIDYFDQAIGRDPRYAPAYAGKAFAYANLSNVTLPPLVAMPEAKDAARRAMELDPDLAEAHTWMGFAHIHFDWDWGAGELELRKALELNPNSTEALWAYAGYLTLRGEFDQGLAYLERAREIDPSSFLVESAFMGFQFTYFLARRYEDGIAEGARAREMFPNTPGPLFGLGIALVGAGRFDDGVRVLEEALRLDDSPVYQAWFAWALAESGREPEARALLSKVEEISDRLYMCKYEIAVAHVTLGQADAAFEWLDRAFEDRAGCLPLLKVDPRLDPIREDPRFAEALNRVGLASPASGGELRGRP